MDSLPSDSNTLSAAEAAVYDRQIRVWGVGVQQRLGKARILFVGCTGVAAEACKNVVLAGIGSITLMDDTPMAKADPGNFLVHADIDSNVSVAEACVQVLKEMNPMVSICTAEGTFDSLSAENISSYQVVILSGYSFEEQEKANSACRSAGVKFFSCDTYSTSGFFFADLLEHTFQIQVKKSSEESGAAPPPAKEDTLIFCPLQEALDVGIWSQLPKRVSKVYLAISAIRAAERDQGHQAGPNDLPLVISKQNQIVQTAGLKGKNIPDNSIIEEIVCNTAGQPAVSAIIGGFLGQEILKAVSGRNAPVQNFFFFDMLSGDGKIEKMPPC